MIRSKKITSSARGEACTMQIAGICNGDTTTTIFAHLPDESHGMGLKADDISGCYACSACHDVLDGRVHTAEYAGHKDWYMRRALTRTLRRLLELKVLRVA